MDHIWKILLGFFGFQILNLCNCLPTPFHRDVLESEVPGALLGVALLLVSVVCLVACVCCRENQRKGFKEFRDSTHSIHHAGLSFTNPALTPGSELSIFPPPGVTSLPSVTFEPLPSPSTLSPVTVHLAKKPSSYRSLAADTLSDSDWFGEDKLDFPRQQLQYLRECGQGWFGKVVEGEARGVSDTRYKVMVKILREDATAAEQKFFLNEAKPYRDLDHLNVLKLLGRCLETNPYLILLEHCSAGDLKSFLCGNLTSSQVLVEQGVCLRIMCQVAAGLQHMIRHGFVHTDLAARNCLVTSDLTVKVGDYGTSIETYKNDYYIAGDVAVPVRWCAPETLHCTPTTIETKQVTAESNVWSLGVVLWEICQFGQMPYSEFTDDQVIVRVLGSEGLRLAPPTLHALHANALYRLMTLCWQPPSNRASLDHVLSMLNHLHSSHSEEDFQRRWDALRPNTPNTVTPEINLETMAARSDFDSGVDLEIKSSDRDILDLVKKSSSEMNLSSSASPQLSVASSSGGEFFSQTNLSVVKKDKSPSLTNLRGSIEDISKPLESKHQSAPVDKEDFDSWLKGVDTTNEEDVKFVKKISEAIRDLDDALALEKTSSSSDDSSRQESPLKDSSVQEENPVLDFRLGPLNEVRKQINLEPLTLQDDSLVRRDSSGSDTDETWRRRIERGEFSEKVKEKSKSVTDLMILTHIESEGSESDSLPSLTRQYSIEMTKRRLSGPKMSTIGFSSEGNIRGAVLGEEFQDSLKQLQAVWKMKDMESRENSLQFVKSEADTSQTLDQLDFLCIDASEKYNKLNSPVTKPPNVKDNKLVQVTLSQQPVFDKKLENETILNSSTFDEARLPKNLENSQNSVTLESLEPICNQLKISPELSEVSDSSQNTESSSEISTPTQYEVQVFLSKEKEHSTLLGENAEVERKSSSKDCIQPTQFFEPLNNESECISSSKTVLNCEVQNDTESQIVPIPDITHASCNTVDILKTNCDINITPVTSNESVLSDKLSLSEDNKCSVESVTLETQDNLDLVCSKPLLSNSATAGEFSDPSVDLVVKSGETFSSSNNELSNKECSTQPSYICKENMDILYSPGEKQVGDIFVPEIVVTEASILHVESDSESECAIPPISRTKRSFRIVLSSSDDETEGEDDLLKNVTVPNCDMFADSHIVASTPYHKNGPSLSVDETYSEIDPTFPESTTSESFIVPLQQAEDKTPANVETSVIFGSCEDYTLEYFKGLKTTFGKQTSDESTDEFSKSEGEEDERKEVLSRNWDNFHTHSVQQEFRENNLSTDLEFECNDNDLELDQKDREDDIVNNLNSFSDDNPPKPKIKLSEHFNDDIRKDIFICDRINMFDNLSEKQNLDDHDQQMQEVKSRLEDVAKLSESFCLKSQNISTDDEENGKLLTPDDERSSDSGFRDKGSLSESVEDACDEKYNLEDIEAELDEQYSRQVEPKSFDETQDNWEEKKDMFGVNKESEHLRLRREDTFTISSDSEIVDVKDSSNSTTSTLRPSESSYETCSTLKASDSSCENSFIQDDEERFNKLDSSLNSDIDHYFETNTKEKTGWYLHPPPGTSTVSSQPVASGWLPAAPEEGRDSSYVSFDIDEEFVAAIRNELREKLPCAQNPEQTDTEDEDEPEEERTDLIIQYNNFPVPLSPILEERESVSSNQSSLLLDENGKSFDESSGRSSPMLYLEAAKGSSVLSRFEEDICNAMDNCNSESTESDNVLVTVEDLENSKAGKAEKVVEHKKDEMDDLLIVDTETNKVTLFESPRPKSQLAFVKQVVEPSDDNVSVNSETYSLYHSASDALSVDRNNLTFTPDSVSPLSTGSSRTGVAVSFSSSETEGSLSGFYLSPSSVKSDMFDNGPPSLPFDLGLIQDLVEEIKPNNEAEEIMQELVEAGVLKEADLNEDSKPVAHVTSCGLVSSKETSEDSTEDVRSENSSEQPEGSETPITSSESKSETSSLSDSDEISTIMKGSFNSNALQLCNLPKNNSCDRIDDILKAGGTKIEISDENQIESKVNDSQEWLKSILLSNSDQLAESEDGTKKKEVLVCVNNDAWPSSEELVAQPIPKAKCESQVTVTTPDSPSMDLLEVAAKFYDVHSTLAISTPNNVSFDESKDNSQLSSFTSTPTLETAKCISGTFKTMDKAVNSDTSDKNLVKIVKSIPSLSSLASDIVLRLPLDDATEISEELIPDEERMKRLQGMTLALEPSLVSKAPMPSPEDADKGAWRPTMGQLIELTNQPDQDDMMTTSFIDADNNDYTPDWESDTSDDSEEHSSSSGEFIWRDGDREEAVHVVIACDDEPQEGVSEMSMARISEGEEDEEDEEDGDDAEDNSSCGSATEFIPSIWDSNATPTKPALRSAEKPKSEKKRNVVFKRQKYHCVYEYPREPSDSEDDEPSILQRRTWQTPTSFDYSTYADWEYGEGEVEEAVESDSDDAGPTTVPDSEYDFYRLSNLDFDTMTQMNLDEGEFFISSSARPFQMGDSSQFFPGSISDEDFLVEFQPSASDLDRPALDETVNGNLREPGKSEETKVEKEKQKPTDLFIVAEPVTESSSSAEVSPTLGELRHTRQRLKLDLGRGGVRGEASLLDSGGEDSGVESTATGSSDRLDQVQVSEA